MERFEPNPCEAVESRLEAVEAERDALLAYVRLLQGNMEEAAPYWYREVVATSPERAKVAHLLTEPKG